MIFFDFFLEAGGLASWCCILQSGIGKPATPDNLLNILEIWKCPCELLHIATPVRGEMCGLYKI
jgi:hypothetical protein